MRVDLNAALHGALNVAIPELDVAGIRVRAVRAASRRARRAARSMAAFGLLFGCIAVFAAGSSVSTPTQQVAIHFAVPAPEPIST